MTALHDTLHRYVDDGRLPGAVALVAHGDDVEVVAVGHADGDRSVPMARESIFRLASISKPVIAAALMMLVEDGRVALEDPVERWLPELAAPMVVRTPESPVDDVVPAERSITVEDLLSSRPGWGFPADFSLPAVRALLALQNGLVPHSYPAPGAWLADLAKVPLLNQPGEAWLYNTASDLQGVLIARASGSTLPEFMAERLFEPLGMRDTGFFVPEREWHRFTTAFRPGEDGTAEVADTHADDWKRLPDFPSGAGGLVSTADDWLAFARMLLAHGESADGRHLLSPDSVTRMTTDRLTPAQREASPLFLEGQGWGYGGSVDIARTEPWTVPGRYGWVGGTGTTAHLIPATAKVTILLTQLAMTAPTPPPVMRDFWRITA
ncbi:serine hydrolase [Streptomyces sp. SID4985]|uniref:serine hydrolase domain-containing protein n=1 Tax=Streptomyces sp. SID4985 TaxID=2690292 RepID=UPI00136B8FF4|nr:serine hydrolase domain-containing protein [Streptomyces sp. SID4985]MYQ45987.1 serine hydrolase [Streptomyces sp. SID4985]